MADHCHSSTNAIDFGGAFAPVAVGGGAHDCHEYELMSEFYHQPHQQQQPVLAQLPHESHQFASAFHTHAPMHVASLPNQHESNANITYAYEIRPYWAESVVDASAAAAVAEYTLIGSNGGNDAATYDAYAQLGKVIVMLAIGV